MGDDGSEPTQAGGAATVAAEASYPLRSDASGTAQAEDRLRRLQQVSLELTAAVSIEQVVATVIDVLDAPIAAPSRSIWLREPATGDLKLAGYRGMPEEAAERFGCISMSADVPGAVAARERRTIVSREPSDAVQQFSTLRDVPRSTTGFVAIPLLREQTCVGVLGIGLDDDLDERDLSFFEAVAAQVAQTVVRVQLMERERRRRTELEFLANLTDTALRAVDHLDLMRQACASAVPTLGDYCALHFLPESGGPPVVASAHVDPAKAAYVDALQARYPYDPDRAVGVPAVIRSGTTAVRPPAHTADRRGCDRIVEHVDERGNADPRAPGHHQRHHRPSAHQTPSRRRDAARQRRVRTPLRRRRSSPSPRRQPVGSPRRSTRRGSLISNATSP